MNAGRESEHEPRPPRPDRETTNELSLSLCLSVWRHKHSGQTVTFMQVGRAAGRRAVRHGLEIQIRLAHN